jgi:hypothetical protein
MDATGFQRAFSAPDCARQTARTLYLDVTRTSDHGYLHLISGCGTGEKEFALTTVDTLSQVGIWKGRNSTSNFGALCTVLDGYPKRIKLNERPLIRHELYAVTFLVVLMFGRILPTKTCEGPLPIPFVLTCFNLGDLQFVIKLNFTLLELNIECMVKHVDCDRSGGSPRIPLPTVL